MKTRSALNNAFLSLGIGSIFAGLLKAPPEFDVRATLPLVSFFVFFRIKIWLDDSKYLATEVRTNVLFDIGIVLGVIAWCLWAAAGYTISSPDMSYRFLMYSLISLSCWILVGALHAKAFASENRTFLLLNLFYIGVLWLMSTSSVVMPFSKNLLAWVLVIGTLLDLALFGSFKHLEETA